MKNVDEKFSGCQTWNDVQDRLSTMTFDELKVLMSELKCKLCELDIKICDYLGKPILKKHIKKAV